MEEETIYWFNCWLESTDEPSWEKLKNALLVHFGMGRLDNLFEEHRDVKQTGMVNEYIAEFEVFSQCGRLLEASFLGYFVGGLKPEIRTRIHTLKPHNCYQTLQMAQDVEAELMTLLKLEDGDDTHRGRFWDSGSSRFIKGGMGFGSKTLGEQKTRLGPNQVSSFSGGSSSARLHRNKASRGTSSFSSSASNTKG